MKFFLDENFPKSAEDYLTTLGHKTYNIRSTNYEGIDDNSIFKLAQEKEAVFLTTDKDFFHTIPLHFTNHNGILIINLKLPNRASILDKLIWALENLDVSNLANKAILLRDNSYTIK